ncbi:hypothetical protein ACSN43_001924 [Escherichia coli]
MTVSTEVDHNEYTGNGVTTTFPYTFRIFQKSDLVVQVVDLDENIAVLALDTDYAVTGAGGYSGGNVILSKALANGYQISISRELPVTQETDLRNQGKFFAEVHEDAFDKLTMLIQQVRSWFSLALRKPSFVANYYDALNNYIRNLRDPSRPQDAATKNYVDTLSSGNLSRSLRVPESSIPSLPDVNGRRNKALSFDAVGNPLLLDPAGSGLWGYVLIDSFQLGATISTRYQALRWTFPDGNGEYYRWDGVLPKVVPTGATPHTAGGVGAGKWLSVGDATLRTELLSANGGVIQSFNTVADMKSYNITAGRTYHTKGYWAEGDGGGALYYVTTPSGDEPNGYSDHKAENGLYIRLLSEPTDLNHGVKINDIYDPETARWNRNAIQTMLRDTRWSYTECKAQGVIYLLGSVNVGRDNITFKINKGCSIRGRYTDPSISSPDQGGHMLGFGKFFDPDNGDFIPWRDGDKRINPYIENVHVILDGDVSTEFNDIHINKYNNNCIGFLKAKNCSIRGTGGSSFSDHRAFNFDGIATNAPNGSDNRGGSINCHIDVGYSYNCVDNPCMIAADPFTPSSCSIKIGDVRRMVAGGYNNPIVINVSGIAHFDINIGRYLVDGGVTPALVSARGARSVNVTGGVIQGCTMGVYSVDTLDISLSIKEMFNVPIGVAVGNSSTISPRSVIIRGINAVNSSFSVAYAHQASALPAGYVEIADNNFSAASSSFKFIGGKTSGNTPKRQNIHDNVTSSTGDGGQDLNYLAGTQKNIIGGSSTTSLDINFKDGNWNFTKATVVAGQGGGRGIATIDLLAKGASSNSMVIRAGAYDVTVAMPANGNTLTVSVVSPNFIDYVTLHN